MTAKNKFKTSHGKDVNTYIKNVLTGKRNAGKYEKLGINRFLEDLDNSDFEFRENSASLVIDLIETQFVHYKGESIDTTPLMGKPFLLQPWQKYIVFNLFGFYYKGTPERRYKEAFIFVARKNGKTSFIAALAWACAILERRGGSNVLIIGDNLKQSMQSFEPIKSNLTKHLYKSLKNAQKAGWRVLDNNMAHLVENSSFADGTVRIEALASNPDGQDSLNSNIQICDELHAYKTPKQYTVIRDAGKAYTNRLCLGITTAGMSKLSFCYKHLEKCQRVLDKTDEDENIFIFICKADEDKNGDVDFTNPEEIEKANPSYGITIRPRDILRDAINAKNDPQLRPEFLAKSLNIFTSNIRSYFNIDTFRVSDELYSWNLDELAKLPIKWYGGADLSRLYDLTASALYGNYKGVDIIITHAFFPITQASAKAEEDKIPIFGWRDDGWLTMTNTPTVNYIDVVNWFIEMRSKGFNICEVGYDRKFSNEFFGLMLDNGFKMFDEPQLIYHKSQGFKRIEKQAIDKKLYYLHSEAYEYCVQNVHAVPIADDAMKYEKVAPEARIDLFDASVFACLRMLNSNNNEDKVRAWLDWSSDNENT